MLLDLVRKLVHLSAAVYLAVVRKKAQKLVLHQPAVPVLHLGWLFLPVLSFLPLSLLLFCHRRQI